jgi:ribose transport system ATP-binding protein
VFALLKRLRDEGLAIVYISHRMHEIAELADDCSVFRNGRHVASFEAGTRRDRQRSGRDDDRPRHRACVSAQAAPRGRRRRRWKPGLSWTGRLHDIDLRAAGRDRRPGRARRPGPARTVLALFGVLRGVSGEVLIDGRPVRIASPRAAGAGHRAGAGRPQDRRPDAADVGARQPQPSPLDRLSRAGRARSRKNAAPIDEHGAAAGDQDCRQLDIPVGTLSGGNQQKVVIGKWLMNRRASSCSTTRRAASTSAPSRRSTRWCGAGRRRRAVLLYSTDYDELIGCCDRVLVIYDGMVVRELEGDGLTEHALIASALNKGVLLAFVAMAQALVVITAGIDLSVGMIFILTNCLASYIVVGNPWHDDAWLVGVLAAGMTCGAINGLLVIYGRLQPIVATIATGAIYFGIALLLRPFPRRQRQ